MFRTMMWIFIIKSCTTLENLVFFLNLFYFASTREIFGRNSFYVNSSRKVILDFHGLEI